jgi:hypothetical protein
METSGAGNTKIFNPELGWIDPPNYSDPNQLGNWLNRALNEASGIEYLTPAALEQMRGMLNPYFQQQQGNFTQGFNRQMGSQMGSAGRNAGALAAQRGLNPFAYNQAAQRGVREQMNPQFFTGYNQMLESQLGNLLNTTAQSQQFKANNAFQRAQMLLGQYNKAADMEMAPSGWDYALAGLMGGLGSLGGAAITKWG